jgi:FkbM family methyltransferase
VRVASLSRVLRSILRPALRRAGFDVVRYDPLSLPHERRAVLARNHHVNLVLDVGANDGPFARDLRAAGYRGRIVSFEPQSVAFAGLRQAAALDPLWDCRPIALGARDGHAVLNVAANSSSSSLLPMSPLHLASAPESRYVGEEHVQVSQLDSLYDELVRRDDRVYLKVDVQGAELEVLRGAERVLAQACLVEAELSFVPLYEHAPRFDEVIDHLADRGLGVLSIEPVFVDPVDGRLLQVDAIFGRRPVSA